MKELRASAISYSNSGITLVNVPSNAAPEWQAGRLGWLSRELVGACPLEGLVRLNETTLQPSRETVG